MSFYLWSRTGSSFRSPLYVLCEALAYWQVCPRSPTTARVYVAVGGNIIRKPFLTMAKCRGDGREPSQRVQRAIVAVLWY